MNSIDWTEFIDSFGKAVLRKLGVDLVWENLPTDHNPITHALRNDPNFVSTIENLDGFSKIGLSKLATICQTAVYNHQDGPDGDGKPKMIRRHWYAWYKTHFAQPLADQLGDYKLKGGVKTYSDKNWEKLQSITLAWFVDSCDVTYKDLWVKDDSRMVARLEQELFNKAFIVVAVEKDSLFNDIKPIAGSLGARVIISGRGKNSKAATEKILRDYFHWRSKTDVNEWGWGYDEVIFTHDRPLVFLHLSDYDFDGEAVIGPTFGEQARRYTPHVLEARIGIQPRNVGGDELPQAIYQVKVSNTGYVKWAEEKALFWATCQNCGHQELVKGTETNGNWCEQCFNEFNPLAVGEDTAYGLEVEALPTNAYRALLVYALLDVMDFDYIVERLRDEAHADPWVAAEAIRDTILENNQDYQDLLNELERYRELEELRQSFEQDIVETFYSLGVNMEDGYWWQGDDPEERDFVTHVENDNVNWPSPWRPFDRGARTELLIEDMHETFEELIAVWANEPTGWQELD